MDNEGEWVVTWITELDGDLHKLTRTSEGEWVLTWLTGLDGDLRKLTYDRGSVGFNVVNRT